uniref:Uncharacterized protein n=1 Tax=Anopheles merus TaxID=30066 RepID=A0A182URM1_ANOME
MRTVRRAIDFDDILLRAAKRQMSIMLVRWLVMFFAGLQNTTRVYNDRTALTSAYRCFTVSAIIIIIISVGGLGDWPKAENVPPSIMRKMKPPTQTTEDFVAVVKSAAP